MGGPWHSHRRPATSNHHQPPTSTSQLTHPRLLLPPYPAACTTAYAQVGYLAPACSSSSSASGTSCSTSSACALGYSGTPQGTVFCDDGVFSGTFSGCSPSEYSSLFTPHSETPHSSLYLSVNYYTWSLLVTLLVITITDLCSCTFGQSFPHILLHAFDFNWWALHPGVNPVLPPNNLPRYPPAPPPPRNTCTLAPLTLYPCTSHPRDAVNPIPSQLSTS